MPAVTVSRHYLDQIDEDHYQLELLVRALKAVTTRLYAVEATQRSMLNQLDALCLEPQLPRGIADDSTAVRGHDRYRRKRR